MFNLQSSFDFPIRHDRDITDRIGAFASLRFPVAGGDSRVRDSSGKPEARRISVMSDLGADSPTRRGTPFLS
ncbi:MAG: hypothetical protein KF860_00255 [Cyclobacteriaceae bacterium]|nr:hypothetical protein [Cyclobacteriaceae bacterium]